MRASRAYIAGLGTTSVLVASALLLLAVVGTLVAFEGWPGTGFSQGSGSLKVDESERLAVDAPVQVALNAAPAAAAVAGSPAPGTAAAASTGLTAGVADVRRAPVAGIAPTVGDPDRGADFRDEGGSADGPSPPQPSADDPPPGGLLPETPLSPQVNRLTNGLGDTTQGLTDGLGGTVGRLNPQLGRTVTDSGQVLAELLRALGQPRR